jgi:hypothetical protein
MKLNNLKIKSKNFSADFLEIIHTESIEDIQQILNKKNIQPNLNTDCLFLGLISAVNFKDLKIFEALYNYLKKEEIDFPEFIYEKLFNSICASGSVERLKTLDNSFNLSKNMMFNYPSINELSIIKEETFSYYSQIYGIYATHKEELLNIFNEHGLITASRNGSNELVEYLLSTPVEIPTKLIESSFIMACNHDHFETAMIAHSKLKNIRNSDFIKKFVNSLTDPTEEKLHFVSKLMLKDEIENELSSTKQSINKKNKL